MLCVHTLTPCVNSTNCFPLSCDSTDGICKGAASKNSMKFHRKLIFSLVNCDDRNPCTSDMCDPDTGDCLNILIECVNSTACFPLTCDPTNGQCSGQPINCDDNNPCTTDSCNNGQCTYVSINCDDGDACTIDSCDGGCIHTNITCDDNSIISYHGRYLYIPR